MYFQYDTSGAPLGFILNSVQYFYITNQMNDVIGITDKDGNALASYYYDEWGKVLEIGTENDFGTEMPIPTLFVIVVTILIMKQIIIIFKVVIMIVVFADLSMQMIITILKRIPQ